MQELLSSRGHCTRGVLKTKASSNYW